MRWVAWEKILITYAHLYGLSRVWFHIWRLIWSRLTVGSVSVHVVKQAMVGWVRVVHGVQLKRLTHYEWRLRGRG